MPEQSPVEVAAHAVWGWRLELLLTLLLTAIFAYAGGGAFGLSLIIALTALVTFIPHTRRFLTRSLHAARVKRQWTQAVIDSGGAEPRGKRSRKKQSLVGARAVKVTPTANGDRLIVKGHIQALLQCQPFLAETLDSRWSPVLENGVRIYPHEAKDGTRANYATVAIHRRNLFAKDRPPIRSTLLDVEQTSVWEPLPFGMYEDGEPCILDPVDGHVLIAGMTRSGKSVAMHTLIAQNALDPLNRVLLFDNKQAGLSPWKSIADAFVGPDITEAVRTLRNVQRVMQDRFDDQTRTGEEKAQPGDETYGVFIDELAYYLLHEDKEQSDLFRRILLDLGQRGASAGVHIYAATQRPAANIIDSNLRAQFGTAMCFRVHEHSTVTMVFGVAGGPPAERIPKDRKGVGYIGGEFDYPRRFRSPYLDKDDIAALVERAQGIRTVRGFEDLLASVPPTTAQPPAWKLRENDIREEILAALPDVYDLKHLYTMDRLVRELKRPRREIDAVLSKLVKEQLVSRKTDDGGKARAKHPYGYWRVRKPVAQTVREPEAQDPEEQ